MQAIAGSTDPKISPAVFKNGANLIVADRSWILRIMQESTGMIRAPARSPTTQIMTSRQNFRIILPGACIHLVMVYFGWPRTKAIYSA